MAGKHRSAHRACPRASALTLLAIAASTLVAVILSGVGAGGTFAAWNSSTTIQTAALSTGLAGVTPEGFANVAHQFSTSSLSSATQVTVANTGTVALGHFTATLAPASSNPLASALQVSIWPVGTGGNACSTTATPTAPVTGTWASLPNWLANQSTLAPNASASYCVLTTLAANSLATVAGTTESPVVEVAATTGTSGAGWNTGTVSASSFTFSTVAPTWQTVSTPSSISVPSGSATTITQVQEQVWPSETCIAVYVESSSSRSSDAWELALSTSKAPFNGVTPSSANWSWNPPGYATTGALVSTKGTTTTVQGVGNATKNGFNASPTSGTVNNTPVTGSEVAQFSMCVL